MNKTIRNKLFFVLFAYLNQFKSLINSLVYILSFRVFIVAYIQNAYFFILCSFLDRKAILIFKILGVVGNFDLNTFKSV